MLFSLCHHLSTAVNSDDKLYADLVGFQTPMVLFRQHRPDACIVTNTGAAEGAQDWSDHLKRTSI